MNHHEIRLIYDDLEQFVTQKKWPVNAVLIGKLQEIHHALRRALNLPYQSPPKRASQFGRAATGSASKTEDASSKPPKDDDRFTLEVETPEKKADEDSDDEVPDLQQFMYEAEPGADKKATVPSDLTPHTSYQPTKCRAAATMTSPTGDDSQSPTLQPKRDTSVCAPRQTWSNRQCLILSDSSFRIVSGFLSAVDDKNTNTKWTFTCHSIGGTTISGLYQAAHEGMPVAAADEVIVHVGVNDVGVRQDRPSPATLKREYARLLRKVREKFPAATITLSHIFPIKTGDVDARRAVQIGNSAMDAAVAETRDNKTRVINFGKELLNGSLLRAKLYQNARHLNAKGGRFVAFHVREHYGLIRKLPTETVPSAPNHVQAPNQIHQERRNPWAQDNKHLTQGPRQNKGPWHNTVHNNNTKYASSRHGSAVQYDHRPHVRPHSIKTDLLEKTLNDFSRRLVELFKSS
jgi:hypothetical protein